MPQIITITGPESTGKTTLTQALAKYFDEPFVEEYAREYLDAIQRSYEEADLWEIARGQQALIDQQKKLARQFLFVDTDAWTVYIWARVKYDRFDPKILEMARANAAHHYFLCGIDVPWEYDPLREHPHDRAALYDKYHDLLNQEALPFTELTGEHSARVEQAISLLTS